MVEKEFLKYYKTEGNFKSINAAKQRVDHFWHTLFTALNTEERVIFKGWGIFYTKVNKPKRLKTPNITEYITTSLNTTVKFKSGKRFKDEINRGENKK